MGSWVVDILFGILSFLVFIASSVNTSKNDKPDIDKKKTSFLHKPINPWNLLFIILLVGNLGLVTVNNPKIMSFIAQPTPTPTETITPSPTLKAIEPTQPTRPQAKTSPKPSGDDTQEWGKTVKLDEHTSLSKFAADDRMSTVDELNQAMNQYRITHNLPSLSFDSLLCNMAQTRADQLQANGALDGHAGFGPLAHNQQSFNTLDEVTFGGVNKVSGVHIVEWGWDTSLTGHHDAISDPQWKEGCAGINGLFAVFIFGAR